MKNAVIVSGNLELSIGKGLNASFNKINEIAKQ